MKLFDANGVLHPSAEDSKLRSLPIRGAAGRLSALRLMVAAQLVSATVLAQLPKPADFGVSAIITTLGLLLVSFGLNGLRA
ncbi:hypothetical protein H7849_05970 [Alloacidobacterium dinghuense]|uniref:Uncharacterized protein n=1 Tax=Alloacidobacterium dinghuense TaxID=2763107 RepID=A0A7G8BLS3_9BACT|nr:hypothetical protein [Alloacidobacterium dinghuense]QNI33493.1 hypothetical protein H7849_05970 [Alloacidobacterium dinghuense]